MLQCGHGLIAVEIWGTGADRQYVGRLQCGHGLIAVEMCWPGACTSRPRPASMRPRPDRRGDILGYWVTYTGDPLQCGHGLIAVEIVLPPDSVAAITYAPYCER